MDPLKYFFLLLVALNCILSITLAAARTRLIYQYPRKGSWFENAAVRQNGSILLTSLQEPGGLHSLNPFDDSAPVLISNDFDNLNSTLGIVETVADTFYVLASNFSLDPTTLGTQPGTNNVYKVVFMEECNEGQREVSVSHFVNLSDAKFVNGLTKFNDNLLLAADSGLGAVWGIDTMSGVAMIVANDSLMHPVPVNGYGEGINGLSLPRWNALFHYFSKTDLR